MGTSLLRLEWSGSMAETELRPGELLDILTSERKRQNRIRTLLGGGLFALFVLFAMAIFVQFRTIDTQRLEVKMNAKASAALWPIVSEQLDQLAPSAIPALDGAMVNEAKNLLPRWNAVLAEEVDLFLQQAQKVGDQKLKESLATAGTARGVEMDIFRSALHSDLAVSDVALNALLERGQSWARGELDHLLADSMSFLPSFHQDTTELAQGDLDKKALQDAIMMMIEIVNSQQSQEG
jgi:hypothetical protein